MPESEMRQAMVRSGWKHWGDDSTSEKKVQLKKNEVPFMFTVDGKLACIELKKDVPTIAFTGQSGAGKTYAMNGMASRFFYYLKFHLCHLNDFQHETLSWSKPNDNFEQIKTLSIMGETPKPLPMVYCLPSSSTQQVNYEHLKVSLSFKTFAKNRAMFMDMAKSENSFAAMEKEILECNNIEEVLQLIDSQEMPYFSKLKIKKAFQALAAQGIISSDPGHYSELRSRQGIYPDCDDGTVYPTFSALMHANLVPALLTGELSGKEYHTGFIKSLVEDIFRLQRDDPYFGDKKNPGVVVLVDELARLVMEGSHALDTFKSIAAQGRFQRLGMIYATQEYRRIPNLIRNNTRYMFTARYTNAEEAATIKGDFSLSEKDKDTILNLQKFQILACSSGEKFVTYDGEGHRKQDSGPLVGKTIPTLTQHQAPTG